MAKGMKMRSVRTLLLGAVGAFMLGGAVPTTAATVMSPMGAEPMAALQESSGNIQDVRYDRHRHRKWHRGHRHNNHGWYRGDHRWRSGWHGRGDRDRHGHHWRRDDRGGHWGHHRGHDRDRRDRRHHHRR